MTVAVIHNVELEEDCFGEFTICMDIVKTVLPDVDLSSEASIEYHAIRYIDLYEDAFSTDAAKLDMIYD